MLRAALGFFIIGLVAYMLGAGNVAGLSVEIGKTLLGVFVVLAVIALVGGLITGQSPRLR
jgi:uncharacterized membrane protein YtjA (UPF0391 family)